jgi:glyoxylase-like metal-dependent hydrolase (beta-lactamase superfamily II)
MRLGDYRVEVIADAEFRLDGGAMFGVVPRALWSKVCPPDEHNRIGLNMNCLFVETAGERILIDTGIGDKWTEKLAAIYGITRERSLSESLREVAGVAPEEITIVVNTHLHFDHAGGNTRFDPESGCVVPTFPNARYFVSRAEHEHAAAPNERDRASYMPENWQALEESGQLELKEAEYEVAPGLRMETVAGHSLSMQCVRLERGGHTLYGFADLVPMRAHVALPWIMSYDLYPTQTLEAKRRLLPQAAREGWLCLFYHDPEAPLCRLTETDGKLHAVGVKDQQKGFIPGE